MWPNTRLIDLLGLEHPIIQAPMAGCNGSALAAAAGQGGAMASLPCAMLSPDKIRAEVGVIRQQTSSPLNLNFFCHMPPEPAPGRQLVWRARLTEYYDELGIEDTEPAAGPARKPFDEAACDLVEDLKPEVISFHFGLPDAGLVARVKALGIRILSSATTSSEAEWLAANGCDAIIAQGYEAGGHRGIFLDDRVTSQPGTMALVPQVVDAVEVPVIAAGGIADGRGIAAAFMLGASGVQIGTAFLKTPEATISDLHREALASVRDDGTAITNVFSGRPARGIVNRIVREVGPMSDAAPPFPTAGAALGPLKAKAEAAGDNSFSQLWSGQAAALAKPMGAEEMVRALVADATRRLGSTA